MDLSLIIPLYNEEESLPELLEWIERICIENKYTFEVILVDDGSTDSSWQVIESLAEKENFVKGIKFRRNYGKSAALFSGFREAKGDVVVTMDADLQDNPDEIPGLYKMITDENYDLVSGWKKKRFDPITKIIPSRLYNRTARSVTGIKLHDFNCGLKAYKNLVVKSIEVYGEMHRYLPVLVKQAGFNRIGEKIVKHQKRKYGVTKYGLDRFIKGFLDLLTISFISRFAKRPMHLFGTLGTLMFIAGFLAAAWLGGVKIYYTINNIPAKLVTQSPYFYLALTAMIIGTQLFLAGFLGELFSRTLTGRDVYQVEKKINF
ncbi:MAG: glycosyltransferase [Bacteroidales bacterium]|nr:glycosyltransferase [Bacteroidales bacterium]